MADSKVFMVPDGNTNSIDPSLLYLLSQNGGFGNGNWIWMMFLWLLFPQMFYGNGFGGFGGFGGNNGTGFLTNQLNNNAGRDLLLQAINGRADAAAQLSQILNTNVGNIQNAVNQIQSSIQTVGSQVGLSGQQVINSVQAGNAALSQQLCQCCCENRLAIAEQTSTLQSQAAQNFAQTQLGMANQTNALQAQMAANHAASSAQAAQNFAAQQLQAAQAEAADQLAVCQQTNQLGSQADRNTNSILNAIAGQNTLITKEFCDLKERELQNKIDTQGDIITQLRGQISNDKQTEAFTAAFNALNDKINNIASKQPNTVPVQWPNIVAANATPYIGNYGFGQTSFWN